MTGPLDNPKFPFDPLEELKKKAKEHAMYIIAGNVTESGTLVLGLSAWRQGLRQYGSTGS